ncbi:MAG: ParA family protein [Coriobacteriaceae bacterium]|nr:ParA family protein [Coriobacteriaceae bacterium]
MASTSASAGGVREKALPEGTCHVIALAALKGGVGKTTCCQGIAEGLTRRGYKVLAIDCDTQRNLTFSLAADMSAPGTDSLLADGATLLAPASEWVQHLSTCDLIGSGGLTDAGFTLLEERAREMENDRANGAYRLTEALDSLRPLYDFILLDTGPNSDSVVTNAYVAADWALVPTDVDAQSALRTLNTIDLLRGFSRRMNPRLKIAGVLVNMYAEDKCSREHREAIMTEVARRDAHVMRRAIRRANTVKWAHNAGVGIYEYVDAHRGAGRVDRDFDAVIEELVAIVGAGKETER